MKLFGQRRRFIKSADRQSRGRFASVGGLALFAAVALGAAPALACIGGTGTASDTTSDRGTNGNSQGGGGNFGTVKLQTAGNCADVNAEFLNHGGVCAPADITDNESDTPRHVPHLPCADIGLVGINMRDAAGTYTIDSIPPTGNQNQVYADATHAAHWAYNKTTGGEQVMDVINVQTLVANAIAAGAEAHPIQGYHFKLQFVQAPQKHKTFWVHCNAPVVTPSPTPTGSPSPESSPSPEGSPSPAVCPDADHMITSHSYLINGVTAVNDLTGNVHQGDHVKVNFTLAAGCDNQQLSLVAYTAPGPTFDVNTASQQTVFSQDTGSFSAGDNSLEVNVPSCFFQVDFVRGPVIEHLGPGHLYSTSGSLIDADNGGTEACEGVQPSPTPTGSPSPEGSPSPDSSPSPDGSPSPAASASPSGSPSSSPSGSASSSPSPAGGTEGNNGGTGPNGQVLAASVTAPNTGHSDWVQGVVIAMAMVIGGTMLVVATTRRKLQS